MAPNSGAIFDFTAVEGIGRVHPLQANQEINWQQNENCGNERKFGAHWHLVKFDKMAGSGTCAQRYVTVLPLNGGFDWIHLWSI